MNTGISTFPLQQCFLVTNEYFKAQGKPFSDPFEMVSEIFYYDFDHSEFGAQKRSRTVNSSICGSQASVEYLMPDRSGQDVSVSSTYPSDYSAFSLAGIFLNITKMKLGLTSILWICSPTC